MEHMDMDMDSAWTAQRWAGARGLLLPFACLFMKAGM